MARVLAGADAALTFTLRDAFGEPVDATAGTEVTVVDVAGDDVAGSPFTATAPDGAVGFTLPGTVTADVGAWTATASDTVAGSKVVGRLPIESTSGFLFSVAELRNAEPALSDANIYPDAWLRLVREATEDRFQRGARRMFTRRLRQLQAHVVRDGTIPVPDIDVTEVVSLTVDGRTVEPAGVTLTRGDRGALHVDGGWTCGDQAVAAYRYGLAGVPPAVTIAALRLAAYVAINSSLPSRATAMTSELGTFRLTMPGRDGPTGIPDVDAVMLEAGRPEPVVG